MLGKVEREKAFVENGSVLLEKLIASCNSRCIPIRSFSIEELLKATNNFDPHLLFREDGSYQWYNGSLEGRLISVKKYRKIGYAKELDFPFTDLVICAKMCAHKNVLKLIGCCLETPSPVLVYESAENGTLSDRIYASKPQARPMPWQCKLKVAREIAHAIAYLHTAFSRPIIHRDIKPHNIFFDQRDIPKLSDFSISVAIPEGEFEVEDDILGAYGFICPRYAVTGVVTEKSDVYSFGTLLLELVTGKTFMDLYQTASGFKNFEDYIRENIVKTIVESAIQAGEGEAGLEQQLQASLQLALICRDENPEFRPTMIDVSKELRRIERSIT
ncbi:serine/threonine-protein kinase ZRK1-like isoform X1 [Juglans microcarpa x Juglans regia]|uniref:serine/threonine-protein kinase ZRK1-like isoform X1 n=1 Tax=Juglans microcarpa x Juglans regia TaxID=2249226 RepID=UPI001B7E9BE8|nr:serine/threonine-protein kinase ZRK1-like isoform X1 [Juglans microcarpa x Juglans regia]XP_041020197.1 serine/threonine-protein kinase ZRK1-like isoform X1 [Juglans microcarpa x Juglans regia]XP_041020198.1 serine/threonine-protein kinase ZRK1-like isoform X1 [Juglans microcarpa x Juglans regia]